MYTHFIRAIFLFNQCYLYNQIVFLVPILNLQYPKLSPSANDIMEIHIPYQTPIDRRFDLFNAEICL